MAEREFSNSRRITEQLQSNITNQVRHNNVDTDEIKKTKAKIKSEKCEMFKRKLEAIKEKVSDEKRKLIEINSETGASLWLSTLPIKDEGFQIDKQSFWDLIKIRYNHQLDRLPKFCACGATYNLDHALSCKKGGFVTLRHNTIRDLTANLLSEVCKDVRIEPPLHQLSGESLEGATTNKKDDARLDIAARGFWVSGQKAFFDVRVFNPIAGRYRNQNASKACESNEKEKKRNYNSRILEVEHGSFTPIVFTAMGGMGRETKCFYCIRG